MNCVMYDEKLGSQNCQRFQAQGVSFFWSISISSQVEEA